MHTSPIFIVGVHGRCGSTYLSRLLALHPNLHVPLPIREHATIMHAQLLERYSATTYRCWRQYPSIPPNSRSIFEEELGKGVVAAMRKITATPEGRLIFKNPNSGSVDHILRFFPESPIVILLRDTRAIIESAVQGWAQPRFPSYEYSMRRWRGFAREMRSFLQIVAPAKIHFVRYEDLVRDTGTEISKILEFLGEDCTAYPMEEALSLPVSGSSVFRGEKPSPIVSWRPVEKTPEFQPLKRFAHWSESLHYRFEWLAGAEHLALGYPLHHTAPMPLRWKLFNIACDFLWPIRRCYYALTHAARYSFRLGPRRVYRRIMRPERLGFLRLPARRRIISRVLRSLWV